MEECMESIERPIDRTDYIQGLVVLKQLILMCERACPTGPRGAYDAEKYIRTYVDTLESEILRLTAALRMWEEGRQEVGQLKCTNALVASRERANRAILEQLGPDNIEHIAKEFQENLERVKPYTTPRTSL
jgi:exonuclease VII small subunit